MLPRTDITRTSLFAIPLLTLVAACASVQSETSSTATNVTIVSRQEPIGVEATFPRCAVSITFGATPRLLSGAERRWWIEGLAHPSKKTEVDALVFERPGLKEDAQCVCGDTPRSVKGATQDFMETQQPATLLGELHLEHSRHAFEYEGPSETNVGMSTRRIVSYPKSDERCMSFASATFAKGHPSAGNAFLSTFRHYSSTTR